VRRETPAIPSPPVAPVRLSATEPAGVAARAPAFTDGQAARLSKGVHAGDGGAFTELYNGWFEVALRRAVALTGRDEHLALDAVQELFVKVARRLPELGTAAALEAWLSAALRSACVDLVRREAREARRGGRAARARRGAEPAGAVEGASTAEARAWAACAIAELAEVDPEAVALLRARLEMGTTLAVAAERAGTTPGAAHGRVRRAIEGLRARAARLFGEGP
jgi:RNA polymerase sigma factor (sigma-70 family)